MLAFIVRRLLLLPVVLIGVSILIFSMLQFVHPYQRIFAYVPNIEKISAEGLDQLIEQYGLNDPLPVQYLRWVGQVLRGNLGWSQIANMPVTTAIAQRFPATAELALFAFIPVISLGIWLGVIAATHCGRPLDHLTRVIAISGWSFPSFVFGILVLMLFYGALDWFPPGQLSFWAENIVHSDSFTRFTGMNTLDALINGNLRVLLDALRHLVLPVITLAYVSWALIMRVMRSSMLEVLRQDYVTTARSKGLTERTIIKKHARRNALMPVITLGGMTITGLLSGVVITETIFNYKGLGQWVAAGALQLDTPTVLGFALFSGILIVVANLVVDIVYVFIDPRVRLS